MTPGDILDFLLERYPAQCNRAVISCQVLNVGREGMTVRLYQTLASGPAMAIEVIKHLDFSEYRQASYSRMRLRDTCETLEREVTDKARQARSEDITKEVALEPFDPTRKIDPDMLVLPITPAYFRSCVPCDSTGMYRGHKCLTCHGNGRVPAP
jgi:hypothetical protein